MTWACLGIHPQCLDTLNLPQLLEKKRNANSPLSLLDVILTKKKLPRSSTVPGSRDSWCILRKRRKTKASDGTSYITEDHPCPTRAISYSILRASSCFPDPSLPNAEREEKVSFRLMHVQACVHDHGVIRTQC